MWHIVVAGGSCAEWEAFSDAEWSKRLGSLAEVAQQAGARYVTVHPYEPSAPPHLKGILVTSSALRRRELTVNAGSPDGAGPPDSPTSAVVTVVADPAVDGRQRICDEIAAWPIGREITEESLGRALFGAAGEPDLVVVLGTGNRLPTSLVWELAYSELVFVPAVWSELSAADVGRAVHEFAQRSRRFGGVEE